MRQFICIAINVDCRIAAQIAPMNRLRFEDNCSYSHHDQIRVAKVEYFGGKLRIRTVYFSTPRAIDFKMQCSVIDLHQEINCSNFIT